MMRRKIIEKRNVRALPVLLAGTILLVAAVALAQTNASSSHEDDPVASQAHNPTGIALLDRTREEVLRIPTTVDTAEARMATLFSWYTMVQNQGYDTAWFDEPRMRMSLGRQTSQTAKAIDDGFGAMERISVEGRLIPDVRGPERDVSDMPETNWPVFHGSPGAGGRTLDPGPQTGEIAWTAPMGHAFYVQPRVTNSGHVVTASPGMTTIAMSFDEKTGAHLSTSTINGLRLYGTPRGAGTSEIVDNHIWVRSLSGSWEDKPGAPTGLHKIDLETGKVIQEIVTDRVDYRRGYAPLVADEIHIAFPAVSIDLRGTPAKTGMFDTVKVLNAKSGKIWWTFRVGEMFADLAADSDHIYAATEDGVIYALNREGASRIAWSVDVGSAIRTTPTLVDGLLYVIAENGTLATFNTETGETVWRKQISAGNARAYRQFSRPVIADGFIAVGAADNTLHLLDARSGKDWRKVNLSDWVRSAPLIRNGVVYAATLDGFITAVEIRSGKILWSFKVATHSILADMTAGQHGLLANSSDLTTISVDYGTGEVRWQRELLRHADTPRGYVRADRMAAGSEFQSSPTVLDGIVYAGGPDRFIHAFDKETGKRLWRHELSASVSGSPTTYEGMVCAGQQGGADEFRCLDAPTGLPKWEADLGWVWVGAGAENGKLFVGTVEGDIVAVDSDDGEELWRHRTNGGIYPHPVTDGTHVYTGSWDGYYYKLNQDTGIPAWSFGTPGHDYRRGGGPDSAGGVVWDSQFIARAYPAHQVVLNTQTGLPDWMWNPVRGVVHGMKPTRGPVSLGDDEKPRKNFLMNATVGIGHGKIYTSGVQTLSPTVDAEMWALNVETGERVWSYPYAGGWSAAVVMDDRVCLGSSSEPFMSCLNPHNGDVIWRTRVGDIFEESVPAVSGDKMYVVNSDGFLYAFR